MATYIWNTPTKIRGPHILARVDHTINQNNTVFGRYLFGDQNSIGGDPLNSRPQVFPNFPPLGEVFRRSQSLAVSWRRVISPRIVNELTLGFSRFNFLFTQGEANPDYPDIPPYDFANVTDAVLNRPRTNRALTTPQILDNLSVVHGSHQFKMGFNFRFYQHNDQRGQPGGVNVTPVLSFSQSFAPAAGVQYAGGRDHDAGRHQRAGQQQPAAGHQRAGGHSGAADAGVSRRLKERSVPAVQERQQRNAVGTGPAASSTTTCTSRMSGSCAAT